MQYTDVQNPQWADAANTIIDCEVDFGSGLVPFTAHPADTAPHAQDILARTIAGDFGAIAPYDPAKHPEQQPPTPPTPPTLDQLKYQAHAEIDKLAGSVRSNYITTVQGQEATYIKKEQDARAYIAAGYPDAPSAAAFPFLVAEADATGATYAALADTIVLTADAWATTGAYIEAQRMKAKQAITAAVDEQGVADALAAGKTVLQTI